jgi:hypothetical protein
LRTPVQGNVLSAAVSMSSMLTSDGSDFINQYRIATPMIHTLYDTRAYAQVASCETHAKKRLRIQSCATAFEKVKPRLCRYAGILNQRFKVVTVSSISGSSN